MSKSACASAFTHLIGKRQAQIVKGGFAEDLMQSNPQQNRLSLFELASYLSGVAILMCFRK